MRKLILSLFLLTLSTAPMSAQQYDLVLEGGRVMDPETGRDAVSNVGIRDGKIVRISSEALSGRRIVHARGLVVAPGFIDLHQHSQNLASQRVKALDGVTTALELEIGAPDVTQFLKAKEGHSLINYGTAASQVAARSLAFGTPLPAGDILPKSGPATDQHATPEQIDTMRNRLRAELDAGGLAIGMGIAYTPGATRLEVIDIFRLAAERRVPVYTHIRSAGRLEPGSSIESIGEVIGAAAITGAALHIVHLNSSCRNDSLECLSMIEGARARGLDVTTEAYPYIAGMTAINSANFNPGWQEKGGISYGDLMLPDTGERLTKERFDALHASSTTQFVIIFSNTQEAIDQLISQPLVMIASDGLEGHPRNAGTYSRVLAQYVREKGTITLMDAMRKMSLMPAQMLERSTPAARQKGRLQEGADADIVVFDPATISDRSTFQKPMEPSVGVHYLVVGGTVIVDEGKVVPDVFPGRALLGPGKRLAIQAGATLADKVLVLKSERKLLLLKGDQVLKTYTVSLGGNPVGPKVMQGDSKTPEGNYVLDTHNAHSQYHKSIHISYPNPDNVARAKKLGARAGGELFIHGLPNDYDGPSEQLGDWTDGCIAVTNAEIDEIWQMVADGTPIEIKP